MPSYVINMPQRTDRWDRFKKLETTRYMKGLTRVAATNGKAIDYMHDKRISLRTKLNIFRNYRRSHHEIATLGAVGASLSHFDVWRRFLRSGAPICLVLEDDAKLSTDDIHSVHRLWPSLPPNWGIWLLGYYTPNLVIEPLAEHPWNRVYNYTAAHAYLLTRDAAKKLLEEPLPIEMHVDHYMSICSLMKDFFIIQRRDVHVPFFSTLPRNPRSKDSNTSQHKSRGCKVCDVPDDNRLLFEEFSPAGPEGRIVKGIIKGQQSDEILMLEKKPSRATRKRRKT